MFGDTIASYYIKILCGSGNFWMITQNLGKHRYVKLNENYAYVLVIVD